MKSNKKNIMVCFDLMETIVFPPKQEAIYKWIEEQPILFEDDIKNKYLMGYPYALFVQQSPLSFEQQKDALLVCNIDSFDDLYNILRIKKRIELYEKITSDYIDFFVRNSILNDYFIDVINLLKMEAEIGIVSNLYTPYKRLFQKFDLNYKVDFIIASCDCGYRKPNKHILNGLLTSNTIKNVKKRYFIGDNWFNDILFSLEFGFSAIFFNENNKFLEHLLKYGCAFFLEKKNDKIVIKKKYASILEYYLPGFTTNENKILLKDISVNYDSKIILKKLKHVFNINNLEEVPGIILG